MSYTPTTWTTGDTITATKLNKIEQGIADAGGVLICNSYYDSGKGEYVLNKTAGEIYDALVGGTPVYIKYQYGDITSYSGTMYLAPIIAVVNYAYTDMIRFVASKPKRQNFDSKYYNYAPGVIVYYADSLNAYPSFSSATSINTSAMVSSGVDDIG